MTLKLHGSLRGCIGSLAAHRSLLDDLISNAKAAAFHLSTIEHADLIYVIKEGKIIESGEPETLLKAKGHYSSFAAV